MDILRRNGNQLLYFNYIFGVLQKDQVEICSISENGTSFVNKSV